MKRLDSLADRQDWESIVTSVYSVISTVQDEREQLVADARIARERAAKYHVSVTALAERLKTFLSDPTELDLSDDSLIGKVNAYVDQILSPHFGEQVVDVSVVKSSLVGTHQMLSGDPRAYLSTFSREYEDFDRSFSVLPQFCRILESLFGSFRCQPEYLNPNTHKFYILVRHMAQLRAAMDAIKKGSIDDALYSVLSRFVWLSQGLASHISRI
jgi:hypothetical protein